MARAKSTQNADFVMRLRERLPADLAYAVRDDRWLAELFKELEGRVSDDFEVLMLGGFDVRRRGVEGLVEAFGDWVAPYESFTADWEELIDAGDRIVALVRQRGVTRGTDLPVEASSALVWTFRDGLLTRMEFFLDREQAFEATGVEPR
jgi:ketosteroid isomerase-like protein